MGFCLAMKIFDNIQRLQRESKKKGGDYLLTVSSFHSLAWIGGLVFTEIKEGEEKRGSRHVEGIQNKIRLASCFCRVGT